MTKRLTHLDVQKAFIDGGCLLLSDEYINARTALKYQCGCGNDSTITYDSFKRGRRCKDCGREKTSEKQRHSFDEVTFAFEEAGCRLLESQYINANTSMRYQCSCGGESTITYDRFKSGGRCMSCGTAKTASQLRHSYKYVKEEFAKHDCILLESTYATNTTPMRFKCSCGREGTIDFYRFRNGARCAACGFEKRAQSQRLDETSIREFFAARGYEVLGDYVNANTPVACRCNKGHEVSISYSNFSKGVSCRFCYWEDNRRDKHHRWNPELTETDREKERKIDGIRDWRDAVFQRDDYTCRKCKTRGALLNAHHIFNYSSHKNLRINVQNGVTLCTRCHRDFHKLYGRISNNSTQLTDYLN